MIFIRNTPAYSQPAFQTNHSSAELIVKIKAHQLLNHGVQQYTEGKYNAAINSYKQVLLLQDQLNDRQGIGRTYSVLGRAYYKAGKYKDAIIAHQEAIKIFTELGEKALAANQLNNLGIAYDSLGKYSTALSYYQKALSIFQQLNDPVELGRTLDNMSFTYYNLGKYADALNQYQTALQIRRTLNDKRGEGITLQGIGNIYIELGQYSKSLEYYQQALVALKSIDEAKLQGFVISGIGYVYAQQHLYAKALEYYQSALTLYRQAGSRREEGHTLNGMGDAYLYLKKYDKSLKSLNHSLEISRAIGDRQYEGINLNSLGKFYKLKNNFSKSLELYQQALAISKEIGDRPGERITLSAIGDLLAQRKPELAIIFYKQAVNVTENIRRDLRVLSREHQKSYTQTVANTYRSLANLLLSQGRVLEAQQVLELLKIQELRDFTRNTRVGGEATGIALARIEEDILNKFGTLIAFGAKVYECEQQKCSKLSQLRDQLDALTTKFNQDSNAFRKTLQDRLASDPALLEPAQMSSTAAKIVTVEPGTVLIYPLVLKDKIRILLAARAGEEGVVFRSFETPVSQEQLWKTVAQFRTQLSSSGDMVAVKATSQQLYDLLIKPLENELKDKTVQHLVFALDRSTRYIPMAALFDGQQYLIQRYRISTVLNAGLTNVSDRLPPNKQDNNVLAMGVSKGFSGFNPLSNVPQELDAIVQQSGNEQVGIFPGLKLLNEAFNFRALRDNLTGNKILHIATHGKFEAGRPENSFLLSGTGDKLTVEQIQNLQNYMKDTHLVVLSACETALGGVDADGIEMSGISFYFLTNGAKAVIASLWLVNDASTSQLMQQFYQNLSTGKMTKAEALRQAQITMITGKNLSSDTQGQRSSVKFTPGTSEQSTLISRNLSHPYYWAPFILIGNGL
ncbi:MAG TPA: CHAT domain-containing protein [Nostoc sp.]|uniref:CHAT domain-containing protein n=1 Tax=Nostoc sp. TaxID=1180 RepID=UPI002D39EBF0|nr:CHAT domain-containing protein [Nostoc sp.]HYX16661.1 CHAT domain-containing protein [Nostoc sp.]